METIKVRVTKSSSPQAWYADKIGETFEVYPDPSGYDDSYILKEDKDRRDVPYHWILREDCIEVRIESREPAPDAHARGEA